MQQQPGGGQLPGGGQGQLPPGMTPPGAYPGATQPGMGYPGQQHAAPGLRQPAPHAYSGQAGQPMDWASQVQRYQQPHAAAAHPMQQAHQQPAQAVQGQTGTAWPSMQGGPGVTYPMAGRPVPLHPPAAALTHNPQQQQQQQAALLAAQRAQQQQLGPQGDAAKWPGVGTSAGAAAGGGGALVSPRPGAAAAAATPPPAPSRTPPPPAVSALGAPGSAPPRPALGPQAGGSTLMPPPAPRRPRTEEDSWVLPSRGVQAALQAAGLDKDFKIQPGGELQLALMELYGAMIENAVQFGASSARLRQSSVLKPRDMAVYLERTWGIHVPGFAAEQLRPYKRPATSDVHRRRLVASRQAQDQAGPLGADAPKK